MEHDRGSWSSNIGFVLAAVGSAVGLGNIWGFPYKMGRSGGFTFLLVYLILALFVGLVIMVAELALGRKTGKGVVDAYIAVSKKFKWIGWLGIFAPFIIMSFYTVLGGYCLQYMVLNAAELAFGVNNGMFADVSGGSTFGAMLSSPWGCVIFTLFLMILCYAIVKGGISEGIEKFNRVGMPALFVMLCIIIVRSVTLPNAGEGLKFMFVPGYAVQAGFIDEAPDFITVLANAGGQMFFSLSLAMGIMVTYGSYLGKNDNIVKSGGVIVFADTLVAILAGVAVIPAAVANGISKGIPVGEISLGGPKLLYVTLQDVFAEMGTFGPLFGLIFYALVLIAATSSIISLMEVCTTFVIDRQTAKGKTPNRMKITLWVSVAIMIEASLVAACCLGTTGIAPANLMGVEPNGWNDCWLDFMDCWSEGIAMPVGAILCSLMIGWELKPDFILNEIHHGQNSEFFDRFFSIAIKFICPVVMAFVFKGQICDGFGLVGETAGYVISLAVLVIFWIIAAIPGKKNK